jgi:chromosomal replication initiation ATPase DnaA
MIPLLELNYQIIPRGSKIEIPDGAVHFINITRFEDINNLSDLYIGFIKKVECDFSQNNLLLLWIDLERIGIENRIVAFIKKELEITVIQMRSKDKKAKIVFARYLYFYAMRRLTSLSQQMIASRLKRDHSTIVHAMKYIDNIINFGKPDEKKVIKKMNKQIEKWNT